jgi:predicted nucleotidyltransferase
MELHGIDIPEDRFTDFCRRHGVQRLSLFGSILRDDFRPDSDIDILVEFNAGRVPSLFGFARLEIELTNMLGRETHLHTPAMLGPIRESIVRTAKVQYAA